MDNTIYSHCPICGYEISPEGVSRDALKFSYWICDCCGCEFGYDDDSQYREKWISEGARWFAPEYKPKNWDLNEQLKNADYTWNRIF